MQLHQGSQAGWMACAGQLPGLTSRWQVPWACRYSNPRATLSAMWLPLRSTHRVQAKGQHPQGSGSGLQA